MSETTRRRTDQLPCLDLRTKTLYYGTDGDVPEIVDGSDTAVYWCLKTMQAFGPDGGEARPGVCGADRACCSPPRPGI
jgi:hypothetical protein